MLYIINVRAYIIYIGKGICLSRTKKLFGGLLNLHSTLLNVRSKVLNVRSKVANVRHTVYDGDLQASPKHQTGDSVDFT